MSGKMHYLLTSALAMAVALPVFSQAQAGGKGRNGSSGAVFVMTNSATKNEVIAYKRGSDGSLQEGARFATGGRGSGGTTDPLGSQGSLTLSQDHSLLFAVNAGSGSLSVFRVSGAKLALVEKAPCGGSEPVAVAAYGNLVYVVNAGGTSSVVGFRWEASGKLRRVSTSPAYLSTGSSGASSIAFSPDGEFLLVTEKTTNQIDAFHVQIDGTLAPLVSTASAGPGLFAVLFAPNGSALAVETGPTGGTNASAISSYQLQSNGTLSVVSTSVPTLGAATCWSAITPNGKYVYTSNAGTGTVSGFAVGNTGTLTPLAGTILATPSGTNLDVAITSDGKFLYTLDSGTATVSIFAIGDDGLLTSLNEVGGLSETAGFNGIAAY
jgi:6-phosphogluconolactonase